MISDRGNSIVIQYGCGPAGFGRTKIDVLTPRSLRISTQGISDGLPFNYVLQARRIGDCAKSASSLAIKAAFNQHRLNGMGAGFGTLSSQSGSTPDNWAARPRRAALLLSVDARLERAAMLYLLIKAAISGVIVAAVSEIARRYPGWGGLVASLPLTSLLAMIWLWRDSGDAERVASCRSSTIWFFIPSVPLFIALPLLIRSGVGFLAGDGARRGR